MGWHGGPSNQALPSANRGSYLQNRHGAQESLGVAVRRNSAGRLLASRKTEKRRARSAHCDMVRGKITTRRAATPRDASNALQGRQGATLNLRAAKRCRRRIGTTVCDLRTRRGRAWTSRRNATEWAASSPTASKAHGLITTPRAAEQMRSGDQRANQGVGRRRAAGQRRGAGSEYAINGRLGLPARASLHSAASNN